MDALLQQKLDDLKDKNLLRTPKGCPAGFANFSSNDYLGMARRAEVVQAGAAAAEIYGAGAGASRMAGGNHALYAELEELLAEAKGSEAATIFGSGYLANLGAITALVGVGDVVYADRLCHACIIDGIKLSGAKLVRFKHNDVADLRRVIKPGAKLIITEEIFSMDGDAAPLEELREVAKEFGAVLMVDGAHSLYQKSKVKSQKSEIYVGTLSKAVGCYGGYVAGSKTLIKFLQNKARPLIYSTALPPFILGAAIKSLQIIAKENPYLKTLENAKILGASSAIIPIILGSEKAALEAEAFLYKNGIIAPAIRPPTVPKGTARLRISVSAAHTKEEMNLLVDILHKNVMPSL